MKKRNADCGSADCIETTTPNVGDFDNSDRATDNSYFSRKKAKLPLDQDERFIKMYEETFGDPFILIELRGKEKDE